MPVLFVIERDDHKEWVAGLKGEIYAIEETSLATGCTETTYTESDDCGETR